MANPIGIAIGFGLPGLMVPSGGTKTDVGNLMLVEAILCTIVCIFVIIFFKTKPKVPPSNSAGMDREEFMPALKMLFRNKNFLLLLVYFSMGQGALNSFATLIEQITKPYGYTSGDNSLFGALVILSGLVGSGIAGGIVAVTQKFKLSCLVIIFGSLAGIISFILTLQVESVAISAVFAALLGLLLMPILPVSYEFGCEITFPIGEAMTGGLLNCGGQIVGIVEVGIAYLLSNQPIIVSVMCSTGILIGGFCMIFVKQELKRTHQDKIKSLINLE